MDLSKFQPVRNGERSCSILAYVPGHDVLRRVTVDIKSGRAVWGCRIGDEEPSFIGTINVVKDKAYFVPNDALDYHYIQNYYVPKRMSPMKNGFRRGELNA